MQNVVFCEKHLKKHKFLQKVLVFTLKTLYNALASKSYQIQMEVYTL